MSPERRGRINTGQPRQNSERRRHSRLPFDNPVTICWMECDHPNVVQAQLINASEGGLAFRASAALAAGTHVWIVLADGTDGCGEVQYCFPLEQDYRIGLEFIAERREDSLAEHDGQHVLEWIDNSGRRVGSLVSICGADSGQVDLMALEVVPCPDIVLLSGSDLRLLCCTRDWRPEKDSYRVQADLLQEIQVPATSQDSPAAESGANPE